MNNKGIVFQIVCQKQSMCDTQVSAYFANFIQTFWIVFKSLLQKVYIHIL